MTVLPLFPPADATADALARWEKARTSLDRGRVQATGDVLAQRVRDLEAQAQADADTIRDLTAKAAAAIGERVGNHLNVLDAAREPGGTTCPTCDQHVQVYRRKVNPGMAAGLIRLARAADPDGYVSHIPDRPGGSWEEGKLEYWGLVRRAKSFTGHGIRGWWITDRGRRFVAGDETIGKYVRVYQGKVVDPEHGEQVSIRQALGTRFDYDDLMAGR